ncbi:septum formation initiator family protein [Streptomyces sp. NPDC090052]|uniref:FtsB family cell division protein n=1 Tax=unclassified Streptomyces TaxID=2593676 RepID=UPI0022500C58|nr:MULTISPECIES: cell division protein FtsL [unclassified Streptomyces]MCX4727123.1 cell division protein FtsL [Streptomyces sp. NBC_01306]WSX41664.1 cell division protein FtsL [Streptomyces sp. NBC_00963]
MSKPPRQLKGRAARLAALMPAGPGRAARMPFVLLVVVLLGGGLITLLLLNSALNEGSFKLSKDQKQITELTDEEQALQRDVDGRSAPGALEKRARELGMVPGGGPAFLDPDGKVLGQAAESTAQPAPPPPATPKPSATPSAPAATPSGGAPSAPAGTTAAPTHTPGR